MKIKIYSLNNYEWWAGKNLKEVKKDYTKVTGVSGEEAFDEFIEAMSSEELEKTKFVTDENDKNGDRIVTTFTKHLAEVIKAKAKFPCCFATTEF